MSDRLGILSHELRSPVAALTALAERAGGTTLSEETLERVVELALAAGRDVERLLSDPEFLSIQPVEVDLGELIASVARPGVVVTAVTARLVCDPTRVRQTLANLVSNGLRHGQHVTVDARLKADTVTIRVADDGPGIDPATDPFARGESMAGSTGYGLWLARAIAEAHGGRLDLVSSPGQGAEFMLVLPRASGAR